MIHLSGNYLNTFYQRQRPINSSYRPHLSPSALLRGGSAPFSLPLQGRTGVYQTPVLPLPKAEQAKRCTFSAEKVIWQSEAAARIFQSYR